MVEYARVGWGTVGIWLMIGSIGLWLVGWGVVG